METQELEHKPEYHQPHYARHCEQFSGSHTSLGGIKYAVGALACAYLGNRIETPEERYLILAGIGAAIGALDTAWRDHVRAREREECRERGRQ